MGKNNGNMGKKINTTVSNDRFTMNWGIHQGTYFSLNAQEGCAILEMATIKLRFTVL